MYPSLPENDKPILTADSEFRFSCHDCLPCFTQCCRDVNIYLTPYDVLRLRRALKIGSGELLAKYTRYFLAGVFKIPLVQLMMDPTTLYCRLVTDAGCKVYENRPWACRMYPLDLANVEGEYQMIVGKDRCMGLAEPSTRSVDQWLQTQGMAPYVEMDHLFQTVMPDGLKADSRMEPDLGKLLYLAYDLDRFSEFLKDKKFRILCEVDEELVHRVQDDDEALLRLAFRYIRSQMDVILQRNPFGRD